MFTGIVTQRATVASVTPAHGGEAGSMRLSLSLERGLGPLSVGDSVAIDGCCLTAVGLSAASLEFVAIPETLRRTTLGRLRAGDRVNVEGALRIGDALGGHLVQGHVDGVGTIGAVETTGADVRMRIDLPEALHGATLAKGSITVDGVSLTVGESDETWFTVYLIPHTLAVTGLGDKRPGDAVNLEADVVGRYVEHHVRRALASLAHGAPTPPSVPQGGAPRPETSA